MQRFIWFGIIENVKKTDGGSVEQKISDQDDIE
jgi:hypothetical protein